MVRAVVMAAVAGCGTLALAQETEASIASVLAQLDEDVLLYNQHVTTLANPFFEGRAPGTKGNLRAADYVAFTFEQLGIEPAFTDASGNPAYFQNLEWGETVELNASTVSLAGEQLTLDEQYTVLGYSAAGKAEGQAVFVGYSIVSGPDGYMNYEERGDLGGKIAIAMRFEPMDDAGVTMWGDNGEWSFNAALQQKVAAAARRGASAVILVNPPGAADPRATSLIDMNSTRQGEYTVPVVMVDHEAMDRFIRKADAQGRSLLDLRKLADAAPVVLDLPNAELTLDIDISREPTLTPNVGALIPGRGELADELIVIGAHYDHVGYGYFGSRGGPEAAGTIHPGADDNASGTSGLLLAAKHLAEYYEDLGPDEPARGTLLLAFTAEESGLIGSRHYVQNPIRDLKQHALMLNMDMIGRLRDESLEVGGINSAVGLEEWLQPFLNNTGLEIQPMQASMFGRSDHASFYQAGVPAMFVFTGLHEEYHGPADTADLINREGAVRVVELVADIAMSAIVREEPFVYQAMTAGGRDAQDLPQGTPRGMRVRFGIQPRYDEGTSGIFVDAVSDGTSAADAGLQVGDRIIKWGRNDITDIESWMPHLAAAEPGDKVEVTFVRDGQEQTTTVTLKPSRRQPQ